VFESRVLRRIFEWKLLEAGEDCTMRNFVICTLHQIYLRVIRSRMMRFRAM
jgi:hypothetical protein